MSKRQDDLVKAEARRRGTDAYLLQHGVKVDPLRECLSKDPVLMGARKAAGMARVIHNQYGSFIVEYRYFPDSFYLKVPGGIREVGPAVELFKSRWFLSLIADHSGIPSHYHDPIQIGNIPRILHKPVDQCFRFCTSEGNENRLDCIAFSTHSMRWIKVEGDSGGLMFTNVSLAACLNSLRP